MSIAVARCYARALYRLASQSEPTLQSWLDAAGILTDIAAYPEIQAHLKNSKILQAKRLSLWINVFQYFAQQKNMHYEPQQYAQIHALLNLLLKHNRSALIPEIKQQLHALYDETHNTAFAKVYSPFPIDAEQLAAYLPVLNQKFNKKLQAKVYLDPALIGGIRVVVGDAVWDCSIQGKLKSARDALLHSSAQHVQRRSSRAHDRPLI